jgi:hypothetical protein
MSLHKLLHQARFPLWTVISVLITVLVETVIVTMANPVVDQSAPLGWVAPFGAVLITDLMVVLGFLINLVAGCVAIKRKEFWGGRIAVLGVVVWIATVVALHH